LAGTKTARPVARLSTDRPPSAIRQKDQA